MSTFFGFNIARSGLFTAQKALSVVSHNIANAETPGYSRQRVEQRASNPMALSGGKGMLGTGVDSTAITQIRNEFLDIKMRNENTVYGQWKSRYESLSEIEAIMNEPSESGIRRVMDDFFSSIQELSKDPSSLTTRAVVRERGIAMANTLNHMHSQFEKMVRDTDFEVKTTVDQINTYANDISKLNEQICKAEMDGNKANDLRDQRNLLMDKLSELVNLEVKELTDGKDINLSGKLILSINGQPLVSHDKAYKLTVDTKDKHGVLENIEVGQLQWELGRNADGTPITGSKIDSSILKGKLKAQLDMRDNIDGDNKGIPYYIDKLNEFTNTFATKFNDIHKEGYGLQDGSHGNLFFESKDSEPITAANIKISSDIEADLDNIAAAKFGDANDKGLAGDASNMVDLAQIRYDHDMFAWGSPDDFVKSLVSNLGVDAQTAKRMSENQEVLVSQIDLQRQSISGVSLDEEMTNMVKFQHAYNAAARMITTVDEMIDVIVNRMGRVGL